MKGQKQTQNPLEDTKVDVKLKLAIIWTSLMFLVIYIDYFHLYMPKMITDLQKGKVFVFDITQRFLLAALVSVTIPIFMISVSVILPAKINRWTNIIVASVNIPFMLFNLVGIAWVHMYFAATIEVALLCLIIRFAWKWPRSKT